MPVLAPAWGRGGRTGADGSDVVGFTEVSALLAVAVQAGLAWNPWHGGVRGAGFGAFWGNGDTASRGAVRKGAGAVASAKFPASIVVVVAAGLAIWCRTVAVFAASRWDGHTALREAWRKTVVA